MTECERSQNVELLGHSLERGKLLFPLKAAHCGLAQKFSSSACIFVVVASQWIETHLSRGQIETHQNQKWTAEFSFSEY